MELGQGPPGPEDPKSRRRRLERNRRRRDVAGFGGAVLLVLGISGIVFDSAISLWPWHVLFVGLGLAAGVLTFGAAVWLGASNTIADALGQMWRPHPKAPSPTAGGHESLAPVLGAVRPADATSLIDVEALSRLMAERLGGAVPLSVSVDVDGPGSLRLTCGQLERVVPLAVERFRLEPAPRAGELCCRRLSSAVQSFVADALGRPWPTRTLPDGSAALASCGPARPKAAIAEGVMELYFEDDSG